MSIDFGRCRYCGGPMTQRSLTTAWPMCLDCRQLIDQLVEWLQRHSKATCLASILGEAHRRRARIEHNKKANRRMGTLVAQERSAAR